MVKSLNNLFIFTIPKRISEAFSILDYFNIHLDILVVQPKKRLCHYSIHITKEIDTKFL